MSLLFRDVEVDGEHVDVRTRGPQVAEVGRRLPRLDEEVVDGVGGALIPGLHDHHVHLMALAAARGSVDCGPGAVAGPDALGRVLTAPSGAGWVRGVGYHESVAGSLDRLVLDSLVGGRPVRIQHRSGALWILNSLALQHVADALDDSADVERDADGVPTGRLWRYDERLRRALPEREPDLAAVGRLLTSYGITGVTDATPTTTSAAARLIDRAISPHARVTLLADGSGLDLPDRICLGPRKLLLRDHDLPTFEALTADVLDAHSAGRPVAVHCVTRESVLLTLAVLRETGTLRGDRLEHAAVVPRGTEQQIAELGLAVVTQPSFLRLRGDDYLRDVDPDDADCLYPVRRLHGAGVPVAASSDAPFGDLDPWQTMRDARDRTSQGGVVIGPDETVSSARALAGYLSSPDSPGGRPRQVAAGATADLCLLAVPLDQVLRELDAGHVRMVLVAGARV
jgi:predicted amidohydrolase YtcJ